MRKILVILMLLATFTGISYAQDDVVQNIEKLSLVHHDKVTTQGEGYALKLQRYLILKPYILDGDTMYQYLLPEMPVYAPLKFKSNRQRKRYNKLVHNVKTVLPIAQEVNALIKETYETLQMLPDKKSKDEHIKAVEKEIWRTYSPRMKKLTYSQGKLLIKLVDRECNQSSYEIVKAFLGPFRAGFYQVFAWTFNASLKKEYDPENDDKLVERVVREVEAGLL